MIDDETRKRIAVLQEVYVLSYRSKYLKAREELKRTNWWDFKKVKALKDKMRYCEYYYRVITGKQIELPKE